MITLAASLVAVPPARADEFLFGYSFGTGTQTLTVTTVGGQVLTMTTSQSEFNPGIRNQGWWSATTGNTTYNDNYYVGSAGSNTFRDFFTFNLGQLTPRDVAISATLTLTPFVIQSDSGAHSLPLSFWDVTTDAATLNANDGSSAAIFADLGSGKNYGTFSVPTSASQGADLTFVLNGTAVADINSHAGGYFSIGGAGPALADVPEPTTLALASLGALGLVSGIRLRRRTA
jgi:hypothetical protein